MKTPNFRVFIYFLSAALVASCLWQTPATALETINIASGQSSGGPGPPGSLDDLVTYYSEGTAGTSLATVFDTEFASALAGPAATVVAAHPVWLPGLTLGDPDARWINVHHDPTFNGYGAPAETALYAAPFTVTTPGTSLALLTVYSAADDGIGDALYGGPNPEGLYLNGVPLLGSGPGLGYGAESVYTALVTVNQGSNVLHIYGRDQGVGISGVIFSATITVIPEPATWTLTMIGGLGLLRRRSRKRAA
jgi:hypothetical protein